MEKIDWHDASVLGIEFLPEIKNLILKIGTNQNKNYRVIFKMVEHWSFSPFETQNILFNLNDYNKVNLNNSTLEEYQVHEYYINLIKDKNLHLYELSPSVGMGGYIIAGEFSCQELLL